VAEDAALPELGLRRRDIRMRLLGIDARGNAIRDEPRFMAIAQRLGLNQAPAHGRY
jgi:hypothetical protein